MLCSRIFVLLTQSRFILIGSLLIVLQTLSAQITREQFLLVLSDALEHDWDFETDRIDVEIKRVELESSKRKYTGFKVDLEMSHQIDDWLDRLLVEKKSESLKRHDYISTVRHCSMFPEKNSLPGTQG